MDLAVYLDCSAAGDNYEEDVDLWVGMGGERLARVDHDNVGVQIAAMG
jgi:hypothetical protein